MLESVAVTKRFGTKTAVDEISIKLEKGHIYAILGPNGSGKTTWMKMAAGLTKPTYGHMLYKGKEVGAESKKEVAYMSTEPYFYSWMTIKEVGKYYEDFFEDFSMTIFTRLINDMNLEMKMKTKALSTGMMTKLKIAVTMARKSKVFLLDEPLNGIDIIARDEIMATIIDTAGEDTTLMLSTHLVEELETVADKVIFIKNGIVVADYDVEELRINEGKSVADKYRELFSIEGGLK